MSSEKLESVIQKVKLLLNLTKNNNSEEEVKSAAAAADRLMQTYRLTQAQVEAQDVSAAEPMVSKVISSGGRRTKWRETLMFAITAQYGCCWYLYSHRDGGKYGKGRSFYTAVGKSGDVDIVEYMFTHLESEVERLCRWNCGGKGVKYAAAWLCGCAEGLARQFHDMAAAARAQATVSQSTALAILDKRAELSKEHMYAKCGVRKGGAAHINGGTDYGAREEGYSVGKQIQIKSGLNASATSTPKLA